MPNPKNTPLKPENDAKENRPHLSSTQVMFAVILTIGLMLAINFSTRIAADRDLRQIRDTIIREIELLRREQSDLLRNLAFAGSDAYVEAWARSDGKMIREGEVLVLPVPFLAQIEATPEPSLLVDVITQSAEAEPWELWWSLFFDADPPRF